MMKLILTLIIGLLSISNAAAQDATQNSNGELSLENLLDDLLDGGSSSVGPANPSAVLCINIGGNYESVVDEEGNAYGICRIEQWLLFSVLDKFDLLPEISLGGNPGGPIGFPNPAALVCKKIGGETEIVFTPSGENGVCVIEAWTLFNWFFPAD